MPISPRFRTEKLLQVTALDDGECIANPPCGKDRQTVCVTGDDPIDESFRKISFFVHGDVYVHQHVHGSFADN